MNSKLKIIIIGLAIVLIVAIQTKLSWIGLINFGVLWVFMFVGGLLTFYITSRCPKVKDFFCPLRDFKLSWKMRDEEAKAQLYSVLLACIVFAISFLIGWILWAVGLNWDLSNNVAYGLGCGAILFLIVPKSSR